MLVIRGGRKTRERGRWQLSPPRIVRQRVPRRSKAPGGTALVLPEGADMQLGPRYGFAWYAIADTAVALDEAIDAFATARVAHRSVRKTTSAAKIDGFSGAQCFGCNTRRHGSVAVSITRLAARCHSGRRSANNRGEACAGQERNSPHRGQDRRPGNRDNRAVAAPGERTLAPSWLQTCCNVENSKRAGNNG